MGRSHKKREGFHDNIVKNTNIEKNESNLIITSINIKNKTISYCISTELFLKYADMFYREISLSGNISHKQAIKITFEDIYKIYKTKVAAEYIPYLIMNVLVKGCVFYSDNGEDYYLKNTHNDFVVYLQNIGVI